MTRKSSGSRSYRPFKELMDSRPKPSHQGCLRVGCKCTRDNLVGNTQEILNVLAKVRHRKCSSAKKRRIVSRVLGLEKTLFTPTNVMRVGVKEGLTLFTNPWSGRIYGKSEGTTCPKTLLYTRNVDDVPQLFAIDGKIRHMQAYLHLAVQSEISRRDAHTLRRLCICFGSIQYGDFKKALGPLTYRVRSNIKNTVETLPWPWPKRANVGVIPYHKKYGVVSHPRYGDIPILQRTGGR